jgi:ligand-binding SRPBCC domain-containing protein
MRYHYQAEQWVPFPIEMVFAFFANPENLPRLMPAWQKTRIESASLAPPPPRPLVSARFPDVAAGAGTKMTFSFLPFPFSPVRVPWDAEITEFVWNEHFCDVQNRGPFLYWKHCHRLASKSRLRGPGVVTDGTLLIDAVEYELPFGPLGNLANFLLVKAQMKSIFDYRHKQTLEMLKHPLTTV